MKGRRFLWRLIHIPPRIAYALGLGELLGRFVLLLTTTGRKSGKPRVTPLQYEEFDGTFYIGSARGVTSDWLRNIQANPEVMVRVKDRRFRGEAQVVTDPQKVADFLSLRLQRHPQMVGLILRSQGYPGAPNRQQLEAYARERALVVIHPE
jgi:deazaflavin-dependent oxidoreductase (nitroreductase family)